MSYCNLVGTCSGNFNAQLYLLILDPDLRQAKNEAQNGNWSSVIYLLRDRGDNLVDHVIGELLTQAYSQCHYSDTLFSTGQNQDQAIKYLEQAVFYAPKRMEYRQQLYQRYLSKAESLLASSGNNLYNAAEVLLKAIKIYPMGNSLACKMLGGLYLQMAENWERLNQADRAQKFRAAAAAVLSMSHPD